mmetsp:Transcript_49067/g.118233  ORF Transcript_49067/g.118233 Transcript_49067/m.118233 type:complete len:227 (+) Transcript_49067:799-1479(+)
MAMGLARLALATALARLEARPRGGLVVAAAHRRAAAPRLLGRRPLLGLAYVAEVRVLDRLARRDAVVRVIGEELGDELDAIWRDVWDELGEARALLVREVEVDVRVGVLLELGQRVGRRRADDVVNLVDLVELVGAGEEGVEGEHLEHDAAHPPHVHLVVVEAVGQQALGRAVPAGRDVLGVRLLRVDAAAAAEVGELELIVEHEDVLGLDVSVEDAVAVHVVHRL